MEVKNTKTKLKILWRASIADMIKQRREFVSLKICYWKSPSQRDKKIKRMRKSQKNLQELWNIIKQTNTHIISFPKEAEKKYSIIKLIERNNDLKPPKSEESHKYQVIESQSSLKSFDPNKLLQVMIITPSKIKDKEKTLKGAGKKHITY